MEIETLVNSTGKKKQNKTTKSSYLYINGSMSKELKILSYLRVFPSSS